MMPHQSLAQNRPEHHPANYVSFHLGVHQSQHNNHQQSSAGLMKRGAEYKAGEHSIYIIPALFQIAKCLFNAAVTRVICFTERTLQLGPITVLPSSKTDTVSTDSKMAPESTTT